MSDSMIETLGHLPECFIEPNPLMKECRVCDALRACEQRLTQGNWSNAWMVGYTAGLDAAEAAVEAHRPRYFTNPGGGGPSIWEAADGYLIDRYRAIDAIRALKEKP